MTQEDSIAQSDGQDLNFRVWPVGLVVGRDDLALDQPVHTVPPQIVLRHSQDGYVFYRLLNDGQSDDQTVVMIFFNTKYWNRFFSALRLFHWTRPSYASTWTLFLYTGHTLEDIRTRDHVLFHSQHSDSSDYRVEKVPSGGISTNYKG